jgi:hypothetical protein
VQITSVDGVILRGYTFKRLQPVGTTKPRRKAIIIYFQGLSLSPPPKKKRLITQPSRQRRIPNPTAPLIPNTPPPSIPPRGRNATRCNPTTVIRPLDESTAVRACVAERLHGNYGVRLAEGGGA